MSTPLATRLTSDDLAAMTDRSQRYELVEGELRTMSPAGNRHGMVALMLAARVNIFVSANKLGRTFAAETGFLIARDPDTVRAPDFAFITRQRVEETGPVDGYWPGAPDLLAEVVSPNDSFAEVERKALGWLATGCKVVWVVEPTQEHVTVYRSPSDIVVLSKDQSLVEPTLLPEFSMPIAELFED